MPNVVLRSFQSFTASDEVLNAAVAEIKTAVASAKSSGAVQVVSLFRRGYRSDLQIGEVYAVPPAVCDDMQDFPLALLKAQIRRYATPEGRIEFELGALLDPQDMSKATLKAFKELVFPDGKVLLVFRACWSSPYDAVGFLYDEATVFDRLREVAYAAPHNPALSSVLDALHGCSEVHGAFVVSGPVTQHLFNIPDSAEQDYPKLIPGIDTPAPEEGGKAKQASAPTAPHRPILRITAANIPALEKDVLSDQELSMLASIDQEVGQTVVSSEDSGLRESPLQGLITAAVELSMADRHTPATLPTDYPDGLYGEKDPGLAEGQLKSAAEQPATYQDNDFGKGGAGLRRQPDYGEAGSKETITPAMVDGPDFKTASIPGIVTPMAEFGSGDGVAKTLAEAVPGVGTAPNATLPSRFAGLICAASENQDLPTDIEQTTAERTAAVGEAHQVDAWTKVDGQPQDQATGGSTTTQTDTVLDFAHPSQGVNDEPSGSDTPDSDGAGQSGGDMGGGTVTASSVVASASPATGQAVRTYVIRNASGQHWACSDLGGLKLGGFWTDDAAQEAHQFQNPEEAHEEVRRNCLDRQDGAIVLPAGIGPLKLASWWSPGRALATFYPETQSSHTPSSKRTGGKDKGSKQGKAPARPKNAQSWWDTGQVADQFAPDLVNNNAPNFGGELGQQESPDLINPFGAPGNATPQAPVSLAGCPEGMNKEYDGVPLKTENNFYGPEFAREFYAPQSDIPGEDLVAKQSAWRKANGPTGKGMAYCAACDSAYPKGTKHACPGGKTAAAGKTAQPGDPVPPQPQVKSAPSFLDTLNTAKPEPESKTPYIDPQQNGDGLDNPSPAYLMIDKLVKGVVGAYVSQLIGAFTYTQRPLELETPFEDKLDLAEVLAFGGGSSETAQKAAKQQLSHALELLSDDEKKQVVNDGQAQAAVWCESETGAGGYTYEVFARVEAIEGSVLTLRTITGIR